MKPGLSTDMQISSKKFIAGSALRASGGTTAFSRAQASRAASRIMPVRKPMLFSDTIAMVTVFACIVFGATSVVLDVRVGYYALKLPLMGLFAVLALYSRFRTFVVGLLIPCYFQLKMPGPLSHFDSVWLSFSHVIIIIMALLVLLDGKPQHVPRWRVTTFAFPSVLLGTFLLITLIGGLVAKNEYLFVRRAAEIGGFVGAYIVGRSTRGDPESELKMLVLGLLLSLFTFTAGWTIGMPMRNGLGVLERLDFLLNEVTGQSSAVVAAVALLTFSCLTTLAVIAWHRAVRAFALCGALYAGVTCFFYLSKAAIILMGCVLIVTACLGKSVQNSGGKRGKKIFLLIFMAGSAAAIIGFLLPGLVSSFMNRMTLLDTTTVDRLLIFQTAFDIGNTNPWVGIGAGQLPFHTWMYHAHNDLLTVFAEHGMAAACLYFLLVGYFMTKSMQRYVGARSESQLAIIFLPMSFAYLAYSQIEALYVSTPGILFMFIAGWLLYDRHGTIVLKATESRVAGARSSPEFVRAKPSLDGFSMPHRRVTIWGKGGQSGKHSPPAT